MNMKTVGKSVITHQLNLSVRISSDSTDPRVLEALQTLKIDGADLFLTEIENESIDAEVRAEVVDGGTKLTFTKTQKG